MIHLWKINDDLSIELNIEQLLKYPLLANIYLLDKSKEKLESTEYFKYLDFITSSSGYCTLHGLNYEESHSYSTRQCAFPKNYKFPSNNKIIIKFVKDNLECDDITNSINSCIKALRVTSKTINNYIDFFNELEEKDYKDKDGNLIDISTDVNKLIKILSDVPNTIFKYDELLAKQKSKKTTLRGTKQYSKSMEGDDELERFIPNEE